MHYFSVLFGKEYYMFRTDLLSIVRSLNTVFTAIGICHTIYVAVNTVLRLLMMDIKSVQNM
jgi:energy-converting hydrogenase Eha subunit E